MRFKRSQRSDGFTLIEVVVVLAILGLTVGMVVPLFFKSEQLSVLGAGTTEIKIQLRAASSDAITQGRTIAFRGSLQGGYWLDGKYRQLAAAENSPVPLRVSVEGSGQVLFFAWGGSSGGRVRIETAHGYRNLLVDAVTGRAVLQP